ncbi:hypothetical protein [Microcoleus sp. FACHB-68]|uniref:hypothetical protein n=1 Tax=Microcoleus sp. FACHB-68 TaxID=2692826 RepID=UPI001682E492|nr:hypothetical protein [Microcoleus sp. FACHB-68]MBD1937748.1 hypothetical protein [Microcoleus sp. FACHB-68]
MADGEIETDGEKTRILAGSALPAGETLFLPAFSNFLTQFPAGISSSKILNRT